MGGAAAPAAVLSHGRIAAAFSLFVEFEHPAVSACTAKRPSEGVHKVYTDTWPKASVFRFSSLGIAIMLGLIATSSKPAAAQGSAPNLANAVVFDADIYGEGIAAGDLDNDNDLDLVVCGGKCIFGESPTAAPIAILLNTSDWSPSSDGLGTPVVPSRGCSEAGHEAVIGLLNDDLYGDIAVTVTSDDPNTPDIDQFVYVYINDPNDPVENLSLYRVDITLLLRDVHGLALADIDGDGDNDLAVAGRAYDQNVGRVLLLFNNGSGSFTGTQLIPLDGVTGSAWDVSVSQFDFEGTTRDLASCNLYHNSVSQIRHNSNGTFSAELISGPTAGPKFYYSSIAPGRLDSDVAREIACTFNDPNNLDAYGDVFRHDPNSLIFIHERPSGTDSGDNYFAAAHVQAMSGSDLGRINAGADRDAVYTLDYTLASGLNDSIVVLLGNGDGTLSRSTYYSYRVEPPSSPIEARSPLDVVLADLNDDGLLDVITANASGSVSVFLNSYTNIEE